jgi:hypothetical protein
MCFISVQILTATASSQTGETIVWYDAATGGNMNCRRVRDALGTLHIMQVSEDSCLLVYSTSRTAVTLTLNPKPVVPVSDGDKTECPVTQFKL